MGTFYRIISNKSLGQIYRYKEQFPEYKAVVIFVVVIQASINNLAAS